MSRLRLVAVVVLLHCAISLATAPASFRASHQISRSDAHERPKANLNQEARRHHSALWPAAGATPSGGGQRPDEPASLRTGGGAADGAPSSVGPSAARDNRIDDLFFDQRATTTTATTATTKTKTAAVAAAAAKLESKFIDLARESDDGGYEKPPLEVAGTPSSEPKSSIFNTINLDNSILEEPEMFTNNHQSLQALHAASAGDLAPASSLSASSAPGGAYNSRHYHQSGPARGAPHHQHHLAQAAASAHQANGHHGNHFQSHNYNKYPANMFANNYNLNYIHSFLTNKPSSSQQQQQQQPASSQAQPTGLLNIPDMLNSNPNRLTLNAYGSGFASAYISASSALSAAVNNIQFSLSQKLQQQQQQQPSQLQQQSGPLNKATTQLADPPQPEQLPSSQAVNASIGNLPGFNMCGRQQVAYREPRVVGGNSTYEGEFPWAVSIQRHGNHHCGGVIVGKQWILTAAHCVRSQLVGNLIVRTGGHTLTRTANSLNGHMEKDYQVEQIVIHDDFSRYDNLTISQLKSSANTNNADIALLKLKHEILWNELAWPVCFPNREAGNFSGHDATVIGWGKLNEKSEEFSNELQKVKLTIIDNKVCQNWFRQAGRDMPIDDRIICAGFKSGGKDACHGDSGGPLLSRINGQYVVVGVVSTGIGCARPLLPGLYSRVSSYIDWIERYITS